MKQKREIETYYNYESFQSENNQEGEDNDNNERKSNVFNPTLNFKIETCNGKDNISYTVDDGSDNTQTSSSSPSILSTIATSRQNDNQGSNEQEEVIEGIYSSDSQIVVPLLGDETSPEMIVEVASSINPTNSINTINIIEAPDQTFLEDVDLVTPKDESVKRRILSLKQTKNTNVTFESLPTHDVVNTIKNITSVQKCEWLVMGWGGRENAGILVRNPVGWVIKNINANLALFKDNGVRNISKIVLAVRPGRQGNKFIRLADNICKYYGANLTLLNVISKDAPTSQETKLHDRNKELLRSFSRDEDSLVIRSNDVVGVISEVSASYDLLIIGSQEKSAWYNVLLGLKSDRFVKNSVCSVLRLTINE